MSYISFFEAEANNGNTGWKGKATCEKCGKEIKVPGGAHAQVMSGKIKASQWCSNKKCK